MKFKTKSGFYHHFIPNAMKETLKLVNWNKRIVSKEGKQI